MCPPNRSYHSPLQKLTGKQCEDSNQNRGPWIFRSRIEFCLFVFKYNVKRSRHLTRYIVFLFFNCTSLSKAPSVTFEIMMNVNRN